MKESKVMQYPRFSFQYTPIAGLFILEKKPFVDSRGFFCRLFSCEEFKSAGLDKPIVQINQSFTKNRGTIRGLHFQLPPCTETKIVNCLHGEIFDVAVDIRKNSPTFLQWFGTILSADNKKSFLIPDGLAHGFQTLTDDTEVIYLVTANYNPEKEDALNAQDPTIGIQWPVDITECSNKDKAVRFIDQNYRGIKI